MSLLEHVTTETEAVVGKYCCQNGIRWHYFLKTMISDHIIATMTAVTTVDLQTTGAFVIPHK
jgi:hypothetical protein